MRFPIWLLGAFAVTACGQGVEGSGQGVVPPVGVGGGIAVPGVTGGFNAPTFLPDGGVIPAGPPLRISKLRTAATPPPTISGGYLAVAPDGSRVVAADPDRDAVFVIDVKANSVQKVSLPKGSEPGRVALDAMGGAHVALRGTGKLARIHLESASIVDGVELCAHPRGVAFDSKAGLVVASCMDGQMVSLDPVSLRERARYTLPDDLRDVVTTDSGTLLVARYRSAELLQVEGEGRIKRTSRPIGAKSFQNADGTQARPLPIAEFGAASPVLAWRSVKSRSGGVWMLHQRSQDTEVATEKGGYGSGCTSITTGGITEFGPDGEPLQTMSVALHGLSVDLAVSPDEQWLAVASPGAYAGGQNSLQLYATDALAPEPDPFACGTPALPAGSDNQTVAVAFDDQGLLYALSREPAELQIYEVGPTAQVPQGSFNSFSRALSTALTRKVTLALDTRSVRDTGHDLFHSDVGQGLACASCHGEALDDGHVWNFRGVGPRRTQNMRGGLLATAPFHWDGDMQNIGHLVDDVMTGRMGGFMLDDSFKTALGQWIDQQPALVVPGQDADAVARGKALFEGSRTQCGTCHTGPNLTNNKSANVGTGGSFQVPGLRGLRLRAPYMHDGCAKTLEDRFIPACGGGESHGKTEKLSADEKADLLAYLRSL